MLCAISGEAPQDPVVSTKSGMIPPPPHEAQPSNLPPGNVFSRALIESHISTHGTDPITSEPLTVDDLIPIKTSRIAPPRPPTHTSIPALLSTFQSEWDALALDSFTLRQQLAHTRQELATALYHHDAAVRVVARLTRERDEAREALSNVGIAPSGAGEAMQIDNAGLPSEIVERVEEIQGRLSKGRRKRAVPAAWATRADVAAYEVVAKAEAGDVVFVDVDAAGTQALVGGSDGAAVVDVQTGAVAETLAKGESVAAGAWAGEKAVLLVKAGNGGVVKVFEGAKEAGAIAAHAGPVNGVAVHPTGDVVASVGKDKSFVVYDLESLKAVAQVYTENELTACAFHPDGHLLAVAHQGTLSMYHTTTLTFAASFPLPSPAPISAISFNENGIWVAAATESSVTVFDLRKEGAEAVVKEFEGSGVSGVRWDYSGQFLGFVGKEGVVVQAWLKKEKKWEESLRSAVRGAAVGWGAKGRRVLVAGAEGVSVLGAKE
ncbi:hypothetical protein V496_06371 [Pseudogymnoascus sp. VKM F-4515 (FW-2607)]|nr:hypothetical protein V496_06371 [Pseudogymnoascus sp. VKM F-4515 (FW-2607)]